MTVVYVLMYFICKICFTVYTGETKINDTYLLSYVLTYCNRQQMLGNTCANIGVLNYERFLKALKF